MTTDESAGRGFFVRGDMTERCTTLHVQPEKWTKGRPMPDGRIRCFCPQCKEFKGFIVPQEPPKKRVKQ